MISLAASSRTTFAASALFGGQSHFASDADRSRPESTIYNTSGPYSLWYRRRINSWRSRVYYSRAPGTIRSRFVLGPSAVADGRISAATSGGQPFPRGKTKLKNWPMQFDERGMHRWTVSSVAKHGYANANIYERRVYYIWLCARTVQINSELQSRIYPRRFSG